MGAIGSYDDRLTSDRDVIRATLGDTDTDNFLLSDAFIDASLTLQGSVASAVAWAARSLIARYATEPVVITAQGETQDYRDRLATWRLIVDRADTQAAADSAASPWGTASVDFGDGVDAGEFERPPNYWP